MFGRPDPRAALALVALVAGCAAPEGAPTAGATGGQPVSVSVATVERRSMPVEVSAIGSVTSISTVAIMPRVTGQIAAIEFREGQDVPDGARLFRIDPRPFEVALAQAQAHLAQAEAQAANAASAARRYTALSDDGVVSAEQFERARDASTGADAAVVAAAAAVQYARMQLDYCDVRAPFGGRTGSLAVHPGSVVKANETPLVTLNRLQPIDVAFAVPERFLGSIQTFLARDKLHVTVSPQGDGAEHEGELTFVDNTIRAATGTIGLKASYPNADRALWPGQFVDVVLRLSEESDAIVAPVAALQSDQDGEHVFVVRSDQTVELRPVHVTRTAGTLAVIGDGLQPGETVVTDGQFRLVSGVAVAIKPAVGAGSPVSSDPTPAGADR